jgi:hypothetical protein
VQSLSDGCVKISKPKTDASLTHSSNTFPSPVSLSTEICFGLRLAYPAGDGSAAILRSTRQTAAAWFSILREEPFDKRV